MDQRVTGANHTIYIRNIHERTSRDELIKSLWALFQQYGEILDICARPKCQKLRGQAWVVFRDVNSATTAMREMQGYSFKNLPMMIQFAQTKSDAIGKLDGTYQEKRKPKSQKKRKQEPEQQGRKRKSQRKTDNLPNHILFVENLPEESDDNQKMLTVLFQNFTGFREVRLVPGNRGIAFVEFESEPLATMSMSNLQGFRVSSRHELKISYAKK
eukprot:TRINITY_DN62801_c0_g3_i1.p2 TRINITY_DN62801_c0_g3~~TRINITY_DN62801_c0_g3_i1.p2  ORF type:complete len:214 (-),score=9.70 TRINITY_DN62801_c0_g3_i1:1407-2048(-)